MPAFTHYRNVLRVEGEIMELPFYYPGFHPGLLTLHPDGVPSNQKSPKNEKSSIPPVGGQASMFNRT
jgi:hypothetical protein